MPADALRLLIARLRRGNADREAPADGDLLARYLAAGDEAAFELLVWRHGGLVLGAARRRLGDGPDAEDAFQATFLTLARKAGSLRRGASLAGWLHRVVGRIATRLSDQRARRRERGFHQLDVGREYSVPDDLASVIDEEIGRLPERYRRVVVLCYLRSTSVADAAAELNCPRGTVLSRLASARAILQRRLLRRGIAPAVLVAWEAEAAASPTSALVAATARSSVHPAGAATEIVLMSTGVIRAMFWKKCQVALTIAVATLVVGGFAVGVGRADKPAPPTGDSPPAQPPDANAERQRQEAARKHAELQLRELEERASAQRMEVRNALIETEERFRELEQRQAWEREQHRRGLDALETKLRDRTQQHQQAEAQARQAERQAELELRAFQERMEGLLQAEKSEVEKRAREVANRVDQVMQLRREIPELEQAARKKAEESLAGEEARTTERVKLRQRTAMLEEKLRLIEASVSRQRDQLGASAPRDLERRVEALEREVETLRREQRRSRP